VARDLFAQEPVSPSNPLLRMDPVATGQRPENVVTPAVLSHSKWKEDQL